MTEQVITREPLAVGSHSASVREELLGLLQRAGAPLPKPFEPPKSKHPPASQPDEPSPLPPEAAASPEGPEPTCQQCGNLDPWGNASWCPKCGYYPAIGRSGEVPAEETDALEQLTLNDLLPAWALQLAAGLVCIAVVSLLTARALSGHPGFLTLCALVQMTFGASIALLTHAQAILSLVREPHAPTLAMMLTNPLSVWVPIIRSLPERSHLLVNLSWGLFACSVAFLAYGPLQVAEMRQEIADLQQDKPQKSLMGSMLSTLISAARSTQPEDGNPAGEGGPESLEEAVSGLAGGANGQVGPDRVANGDSGGNDGGFQSLAGVGGAAGGGTDSANSGSPAGASGEGESATRSAADGKTLRAAGQARDPAEPSSKTAPTRVGTVAPGGSTSQRGEQSPPSAEELPAADSREKLEAVVFGYLASVDGEVRTLLLAASGPDGRPRFVGKLTSEAMTASAWESLVGDLSQLRTRRPLVSCPYYALWVEPRMRLTIEFERWSATGLVDARVTAVERR